MTSRVFRADGILQSPNGAGAGTSGTSAANGASSGLTASRLSSTIDDRRLPGSSTTERGHFARTHHRVARNKNIMLHGRASFGILTMTEGWAFRSRMLPDGRRRILSILLPGDRVGFEALTKRMPQYSVQSVTAAAYSILDATSSSELLSDRSFVEDVLDRMITDQATTDDWLTYLVSSSAEERVAALMVDLYARLERLDLARDSTFTMELTQQQMAEMIGLHAIHLNRVIRAMKAQELIAINGREVTLLDMAQLRGMCPRFGPVDN